MAQNDLIKRYLDTGIAYTQLTQSKAQSIVKDLVKTGEVQTEQAQALANALVERSRKNTEKLVATVRKEVRDQVSNLGLATQADIARLEKQIASLKTTAKKAPAKKAAAKKAPAKKAAAKKAAS
jgi:polyhydroxyalkanoate synthesis regulator phasin